MDLELVAIDMPNGMTYIGMTEKVRPVLIRDSITVPTKDLTRKDKGYRDSAMEFYEGVPKESGDVRIDDAFVIHYLKE